MRDITPRTAWAYAGTNYDTELEAINANLKALCRQIIKKYSNDLASGLIEHDLEIASLLTRRAELSIPSEALAIVLEGTRPDTPEGTHELACHAPECASYDFDGAKMRACDCGVES